MRGIAHVRLIITKQLQYAYSLSNLAAFFNNLSDEDCSRKVPSNLIKPVAIRFFRTTGALDVMICNEDNSICSEFGDFKSCEDYRGYKSVRRKVCDYELYNIPSFYNFTRLQYDKYVPPEYQSSFPFYDFTVVGSQMAYLYFDSTKIPWKAANQEQVQNFWCD